MSEETPELRAFNAGVRYGIVLERGRIRGDVVAAMIEQQIPLDAWAAISLAIQPLTTCQRNG